MEDLVVPGNFPEEVTFYFGSQTGTAEKYCKALEEEASKIGIQSPITMDFEQFEADTFKNHKLVIICAATHYEGDPCDNTKKFFKWVRESLKTKDNTLLKGVKFTIFGLGDTSYEQYNYIGRYFDKSLEEMGAERVFKYGEGNAEKNSTEDDFNEWKANMWKELFEHYASSETIEEKTTMLTRKLSFEKEKSQRFDSDKPYKIEYPLMV